MWKFVILGGVLSLFFLCLRFARNYQFEGPGGDIHPRSLGLFYVQVVTFGIDDARMLRIELSG